MADKTVRQLSTTIFLMKTGQTTSYYTGDDGTYKKGNPRSPRFVNNNDGTISDLGTGLMWVKQPELIIPGTSVIASNQVQVAHGNYATAHAYAIGDLVYDTGASSLYYVCIIAHTSNGANIAADLVNNPASWIETVWTASAANLTTPATFNVPNGIIACEALTYAGFSDWRLPNVLEYISILNWSAPNGYYHESTFTNFKQYYKTSTNMSSSSSQAAMVDYNNGYVSLGTRTIAQYIRPVRSNY